MQISKRKRIVLIVIAIFICVIGGWLAMPSNYYVRQILIHWMPKIDQYPIFENRIVKAGDPRPWTFAADYNKQSIPDKYLPIFEKYGTVSYLIIQDTSIVFEQYWENYSPTSLSNSFSMSKSIVSLAFGCAIEDGAIQSLDQPVSDFFPEFGGYNGKPLTIRHLLTMSAGLDFQESYTSPFSPTVKLYYGDDLHRVTFDMKEIEEPGVNFIYQSGVSQLLAYILEKATKEPVAEYVSRKLWTPIHAEEDALWSLDHKDGMEKAYCCFNSNARDFARFGQLILNHGCWDSKQIVPSKYINEATTADSLLIFKKYDEPNRYYGFQFWIVRNHGMKIPFMRGMLGQYVFIIPEKNAVVVRLGHLCSIPISLDGQHYSEEMDSYIDAALDILAARER